jgi:hypothetical protein
VVLDAIGDFGKNFTSIWFYSHSPKTLRLKTLMQNRVLKLLSTNSECQNNNNVLAIGLSNSKHIKKINGGS